MSTFRPDGALRNNDDTQLWKEMLAKERFATKIHQDYRQTDAFAQTHASRFGAGKFSMTFGESNTMRDILNNDLSKT